MNEAPEFLTVPELAELLRIKERKVYDLAASGVVPCNRATGKLLFPESEIRAWISSSQTGTRQTKPLVFLGSHDPLLEWALRQSQCGLATFFDGSTDGLRRLAHNEGIATGLHIQDEDGDGWNIKAVTADFAHRHVVMIGWAKRRRGLVLRPNDAAEFGSIDALEGRRVAARQPGSGTAVLFERLVETAGVSALEMIGPYHSEQDAVLAVSEEVADAAFGLEVVAYQLGLAFVPMVSEHFDLLVDRAAFFEPSFQKFLAFCRGSGFRARAELLRGYDIADLGEVRWNA